MNTIKKISVSLIKWYLRLLIIISLGYSYYFFFQHFFLKDDWYGMLGFDFCIFMIGGIINTIFLFAIGGSLLLLIGGGLKWIFCNK